METPESVEERTSHELTPVQRVDVWELPPDASEDTRTQVAEAMHTEDKA